MAKIQIVSDLHLEFRGDKYKGIIKPSAPILCLLGDICVLGVKEDWETFQQFIKYISPKFKHLIMVTGNHEYYTSNRNITDVDTMQGIDIKLKEFAKTVGNFHVLNDNTMRLTINKKVYVFIGTTMWTYVSPKHRKVIQTRMNDYAMNWVRNEKPKTAADKMNWKPVRHFNVDDMSKLHAKAVRYVIKELKRLKSNEVPILLTHHKPVRTKPEDDILTHGYETDLTAHIIKPPLVVAAHGHTHQRFDKKINGVRIVSSPLGYPGQRTIFNNAFVIDI